VIYIAFLCNYEVCKKEEKMVELGLVGWACREETCKCFSKESRSDRA